MMVARDLTKLSDEKLATEVYDLIKDEYAKVYLKVIKMGDLNGSARAINTQWLYVRNNLTSWRGEVARMYKKEIDRRIAIGRNA